MYMVEISDSKISKMSEYAEDALHSMGRLMSCISSLEGGYGERSEGGRYGNRYDDDDMRMGMRGRYGMRGRMGYRDEDDDDDDEMMGERRGRRRRDTMGRYR